MTPSSYNAERRPLCVYIAARGHSGSTVLELLLNRFPSIAAIGELDQLPLQIYRDGVTTRWNGTCSCGARPDRCIVWGSVLRQFEADLGADMVARPFAYPISDVSIAQEHGLSRPLQYLGYRYHRLVRSALHASGWQPKHIFPYRRWIERRDYLYENLAAARQVDILVDSSKDPFQMYDLIKYSRLPIKVLYLTRDVRGNAWSTIRRDAGTARSEARSWVSVNSQILAKLRSVPESLWMQVKYEDLCARTNESLEAILEFFGLEDQQLTPIQERARRHTIAGNRVRLNDLNQISHDTLWKENLGAKDLADIRQISDAMAQRLGYDL